MDQIRIENLRALKDTGVIDLKPITLLVGANSSGKSTFLRTFPLLKQGRGVNKQGPILWYGTEVDFGSYEEALRKGANTMRLTFGWRKFTTEVRRIDAPSILSEGVNVNCSVEIGAYGYNSFVSQVILNVGPNIQIEIHYTHNGLETIIINGEDIKQSIDCRYRQSYGQILPIVYVLPLLGLTEEDEEILTFPLFPEEFISLTLKTVTKLSSHLSDDNDEDINIHNPYGSDVDIIKNLEEEMHITLSEKERAKIIKDESWKRFRKSIVLFHLGGFLADIDKALQQELNGCVYIKPFRAYAERYYRKQNLAVKDLDSDGHNMAMIIENMSRQKTALKDFNTWTDQNFKFTVKVERSRGHVSLLIKERDTMDYCNITDKGFGYSQVLPIILALWQILMNMGKKAVYGSKRTKIVAFEQPELHLHPRLQAMVMDAIIAIERKALELNYDLKFIVETHSPVMINRLGIRIARENTLRDQSTVLLFDDHTITNPAVATYDNGGYLLNWPLGFLEPDFD